MDHNREPSLQNFRFYMLLLLTAALFTLAPKVAFAQDKSGVKPQVISLPSGPGSLEGLGENFAPNLSTGTSSYPVKFTAAPGRVGFQPELALNYNGGNANGPWGMGWDLSIPSIQRRTEDGLPTYDDAQDTFLFSNGEKLVALKDGSYRFENESTFMRFRRIAGGGWEAQMPDGLRYLFGETPHARVVNAKGVFRWELERMIEPHGNELHYTYLHDGGYAYPREIRYNVGANTAKTSGGGPVHNAVIFNYESRPDTYTDRRSGAPIRVGLRGTDIQMWALGKLVRAYAFTYEPERSTGKYSLLIQVAQVGDDGVSKLPPHTFTYTQFDATAHAVVPMQNPPPVLLTNRDADLVDINADGLPDLVYTPEDGQHRFYLNRGHARWAAEPIIPDNSPAERLSNPNVRMADMNGDGRVDLLVKASGTGAPLYYYRNQPGADWEKEDRVDFGPAPAFDLNDPNVQLMDVNNDHRIDVVLTTSGRLKIWLARDSAWSQTADFDVPAPAAGDTANFADPKFKVGDMTGDRMKVNAATDYNGNAYLYTFDTFGRMAKMIEPGDTLALPTEEYSYFMGSPRSFIRVDKRERSGETTVQTTVTYFDGLGRTLQARVEAENGQVIVTDAKRFNARQTVSADYLPYVDSGFDYRAPDPANPATTYEYDAMARVMRTVNPDGTFSAMNYQPLQQVQFDEEDNRADSPHANTPKTLTYDGLNRLIEVIEINIVNGQPTPIAAQYTYDRLNNLISWQDQAGNLRTNRYDALSRKLQTDDPDQGVTHYQYDDNGNLIKQQDAKGQTILYTYDAANRLLTERWQFTNGQADVVAAQYHYDGDLSPGHPKAQNTMGQISYIEDQVGAIYFSYDARGNTIGQARYFTQENLTFVTNFTFDAQDRTTSVRYPNGVAVSYEYNERGLLKRIPSFVDAITYRPDGQRTTIAYTNGTQTTYGFDIRQRLTHLRTDHGTQTLQDLTYRFDGASNIVALTDGRPTRTPANDQTQQYGYDSLYRLVQATGAYGQIDYGYDPLGNMVSQSSTTSDARLHTGDMRYGENGAGPHALTSAAGESYTYDANGNLVRKGPVDDSMAVLYHWDARDRLIGVDGGGVSASYTYNADSQRLKQTVRVGEKVTTTLYIGQYTRLQGNQLFLYIFDDETRVAELAMTFDPTQLLTTFDSVPATTPPANLTRRWYVTDHLGGTNLLTNDAGAIIAETVYYPYGVTRMTSNSGATPYGFAGKELDATGLNYVEARYYDASTGRFLSVDPLYHKFTGDPAKDESYRKYLEHTQLGNGYAYSLGNPLKYVDPDGREVHISKGLRSVPQFMKAWQMFKATREGQRLLKSLADAGRTVYLRAGRPHEYDHKVKGRLGSTELAINFYMSPSEDGVIVNIYKHVNMHKGDVVNLRKELADTIHHELRHSEIRAQVSLIDGIKSLADKLGFGDRVNSYRDMQENVDNLKDDYNLDFRREIDFGGH